ncbi:MAG: sulfite exporter TauE/SafE family protein [Byssovorax sp.]
MNLAEAAVLALSGAAAGAINAVAGGGTLISFPAAVALGLSPLVANATNAVALTPGSVASAFGYRREIEQDRAVLRLFLPPAAIGAAIGSVLLLVTPQRVFDTIVPGLVLFATALLLHQNLRKKKAAASDAKDAWNLPENPRVSQLLQLAVGVYGGYFGAGMGIMMLAILDRTGGTNIHRMNGVKSVLGATINAIAAVAFVIAGAIDYRAAAVLAVGAIAGGLLGAEGARRVDPRKVRWGVVAIGFALSVTLAYKRWASTG